jgi:diacylglycerol kinase family enzyme
VPIAIKEFYRYSPEQLEIVIGNRHIEVTPFILTVANVPRFGGNAIIAPDAKPDDGLLDLVIVPEVGLKKSYQLTNKLMKGQIDSFKGYQCIKAEEIEIRRETSSMVHADGEPFEWQGSIHISVVRAALKVLI